MNHPPADALIARIEHQMAAAAVPADQWELVRRALILSLHPAPLETAEGPEMAADLLLAVASMDAEPDVTPGVEAVREGTRRFLIEHQALTEENRA